jgi:hypothetical protein
MKSFRKAIIFGVLAVLAGFFYWYFEVKKDKEKRRSFSNGSGRSRPKKAKNSVTTRRETGLWSNRWRPGATTW